MDRVNYGDFQEHDQQIAVSYKLKAMTYNPPHISFEHVFSIFLGVIFSKFNNNRHTIFFQLTFALRQALFFQLVR